QPDLFAEFEDDVRGAGAELRALDYANDSRLEWLLRLLDLHRDDKFLLIATRRAKVEAIDAALRTRTGAAVACFHEGMTLLQRDRAAAWFAQTDGARLLLCSEIGSEGRNFQFAHRLVLWDLPLDPDLIEQRIGRLDRIGQGHPIVLHVPCVTGSGQEVLLRWHADGTRVLRECPADGRDRLLELAAQHAGGAALLRAMRDADKDESTHALMQECFEPFGVHAEDLGDGSVLLDPKFLSTDALAGFGDGPRRVTFDRALALAREELDLLRMDHPLAAGALDLLLTGEFGN